MAKKKAYLERATNKELLMELRLRTQEAARNRELITWNVSLFKRVEHILGVYPKELLDYKREK